MKWSTAFIVNRWCIDTFLELSVDVAIGMGHIEFADPGIMVYEDVGFRLDISDGLTVMGYCFVRRVCIRSTVQTLNYFPHVRAVWVGHCVLKKIFPAFCLDLVDSFGGFTTSIYPLLSILMRCSMEAIQSADFGTDLRIHPRFRLLAGFRFSNVSCCSWDENIIEVRDSNR